MVSVPTPKSGGNPHMFSAQLNGVQVLWTTLYYLYLTVRLYYLFNSLEPLSFIKKNKN